VPFKKHSMEEIAGKLAGDLAGCSDDIRKSVAWFIRVV